MQPRLGALLAGLHYGYPVTIFVYYIISSLVATVSLHTATIDHKRRLAIQTLLFFAILTYFAHLLLLLFTCLVGHDLLVEQDSFIGVLSCILVFGVQFAGMINSDDSTAWYPFLGSFFLGLVFEPLIDLLSFRRNRPGALGLTDLLSLSVLAARWLALFVALVVYFGGRHGNNCRDGVDEDPERQALISRHDETTIKAREQDEGYGSTSSTAGSSEGNTTDAAQPTDTEAKKTSAKSTTAKGDEDDDEKEEQKAKEAISRRLKEHGNWVSYVQSYLVSRPGLQACSICIPLTLVQLLLPHLYPLGNRALQLRVVLVGLCLLSINVVNLLVPRQLGIVIDSLSGVKLVSPWTAVLIFSGLKLLASDAGIELLRTWLWIPVKYYSFESISTSAYAHVLNLSADFHDSKSSSEIITSIQAGRDMTNLLESICFRALPMVIDFAVAFVYLSLTLGPYEGFITAATAIVFFYITSRSLAGFRKAHRGWTAAWFQEAHVRQSGIQGWTTVTGFTQTQHEQGRYSDAVKKQVGRAQTVYTTYAISSAFQCLVMMAGLLAGAFLAVFQVRRGQATAGDFIMLQTYWAQLIAPLRYFAGLGQDLSRNLAQAEKLLETMQTKPSIVNREGARPFELEGGHVRFEHVSFSYDDKKEVLKDISFEARPGETVAFVGSTGAGKSTILKLLPRFYDNTAGSIKIDGQDIHDVTLTSLREQIGMVPQNPALFDTTVMENVRYAKRDASDEEVHEACRAASIHKQILNFADGYNTKVGERGVKLSGGEVQRIAIARALLKRPAIVLLDEATSAVDTDTECKIQEALNRLCKGRTTFVVAHRLSTVMNADRIFVVMGGEIVEQGDHRDLIGAGGKYADLWAKQIFWKPRDETKDDPERDSAYNSDDQKLTSGKTKGKARVANGSIADEIGSVLATVDSNTEPTSDGQVKKSGDGTENVPVTWPTWPTSPANGSSGHVQEGSRLNPDAQPFTPRSMAAAALAASNTASPCPTRANRVAGAGISSYEPRVSEPSYFMSQQPMYYAAPMIMMPTPYSFFQSIPTVRRDGRSTDSSISTGAESIKPVSGNEAVAEKPSSNEAAERCGIILHSPCYSRRVQSKSEPSSSNQDSSPTS